MNWNSNQFLSLRCGNSKRLMFIDLGILHLNYSSFVFYLHKFIALWYICCRPGRLEVHIEINLPDENGRLQILQIHTNKMKENSFLSPDINLHELGLSLLFWRINILSGVAFFITKVSSIFHSMEPSPVS